VRVSAACCLPCFALALACLRAHALATLYTGYTHNSIGVYSLRNTVTRTSIAAHSTVTARLITVLHRATQRFAVVATAQGLSPRSRSGRRLSIVSPLCIATAGKTRTVTLDAYLNGVTSARCGTSRRSSPRVEDRLPTASLHPVRRARGRPLRSSFEGSLSFTCTLTLGRGGDITDGRTRAVLDGNRTVPTCLAPAASAKGRQDCTGCATSCACAALYLPRTTPVPHHGLINS